VDKYPWSVPGPENEPLHVHGIRFAPSDAKKWLIVTAGTHGIEGWAGVRVIRQALDRNALPAHPTIGVLLIAPVNPFGFAHGLRVDQHNIDVNRGCLLDGEIKPDDSAFASLLEILRPSDWRKATEEKVRLAMRTRLREIAMAAAVGQYSYEDAIFYGGKGELCESGQILKRIAQRLTDLEPEAVAMLDLHTGLGPYAKGEIFATTYNGEMRERLDACFGTGVQYVNLGPSSALYQVRGSILNAMENWLDFGREKSIFAALEIGPKVPAYEWMAAENFLRQTNKLSKATKARIRKGFEELFFPKGDLFWEGAFYSRAVNAFDQMKLYLEQR
jgi:hypothetical protein